MFLVSAFRNVMGCLFNPPLEFMPSLYAGLMITVSLPLLTHPRLFEVANGYELMSQLPEWVWGAVAALLGLAVAALSKGPRRPLRVALAGCCVYLGTVVVNFWTGSVGFGVLSAVLAYMALGAGRAFVALGNRRGP